MNFGYEVFGRYSERLKNQLSYKFFRVEKLPTYCCFNCPHRHTHPGFPRQRLFSLSQHFYLLLFVSSRQKNTDLTFGILSPAIPLYNRESLSVWVTVRVHCPPGWSMVVVLSDGHKKTTLYKMLKCLKPGRPAKVKSGTICVINRNCS